VEGRESTVLDEELRQQELTLASELADDLSKAMALEIGTTGRRPRAGRMQPTQRASWEEDSRGTPESRRSTPLGVARPAVSIFRASPTPADPLPGMGGSGSSCPSKGDAAPSNSGVEVASFGTVASLGTDGAGLRTLATIEEEVALLSILDRVMRDVGKELPESSLAQRWKSLRPVKTWADTRSTRRDRGADTEHVPVSRSLDSRVRASSALMAAGRQGAVPHSEVSLAAKAVNRPASASSMAACSVASVQPSRALDERHFSCEVSKVLWQEIHEHLDETLMRPAVAVQDRRSPLIPGPE